jgi:hypothetical protein
MADIISIVGTIEKASDARAGFSLPIDISEELVGDIGAPTFTLVAGGTQEVDVSVLDAVDFLVILSPQRVNATVTYNEEGDNASSLIIVREFLALQTEGITGISIENPSAADANITVIATARDT